MKKKILVITGISLIALIISLGACRQIQNEELKSPKELVMMAVEEEYYQLDNGSGVYLLTHTAVIQTPSLELVEETEGETYGDYLYVKNHAGNYYLAFFRHSLVVDNYNNLEEYVYMSAIAWEDRSSLKRSLEIGIYEWQIQDLDIEKVE